MSAIESWPHIACLSAATCDDRHELGVIQSKGCSIIRLAQVALSLYVHLGRRVLLQVEAFLGRLLLPLAEGKAALGIARQEAALEVRRV